MADKLSYKLADKYMQPDLYPTEPWSYTMKTLRQDFKIKLTVWPNSDLMCWLKINKFKNLWRNFNSAEDHLPWPSLEELYIYVHLRENTPTAQKKKKHIQTYVKLIIDFSSFQFLNKPKEVFFVIDMLNIFAEKQYLCT